MTMLFLIALSLLTGCQMMIGNGIYNSIQYNKVAVVSEIEQCIFMGKITIRTRPNRDRQPDAYLDGVLKLKFWKGIDKIGGNALYNIRMTEPDFPLAEADAYQCPDEVLQKYKPLQKNKDFIHKLSSTSKLTRIQNELTTFGCRFAEGFIQKFVSSG